MRKCNENSNKIKCTIKALALFECFTLDNTEFLCERNVLLGRMLSMWCVCAMRCSHSFCFLSHSQCVFFCVLLLSFWLICYCRRPSKCIYVADRMMDRFIYSVWILSTFKWTQRWWHLLHRQWKHTLFFFCSRAFSTLNNFRIHTFLRNKFKRIQHNFIGPFAWSGKKKSSSQIQ